MVVGGCAGRKKKLLANVKLQSAVSRGGTVASLLSLSHPWKQPAHRLSAPPAHSNAPAAPAGCRANGEAGPASTHGAGSRAVVWGGEKIREEEEKKK